MSTNNGNDWPTGVIDIAERIKMKAELNGVVPAAVDIKSAAQVYECGRCNEQAHRLMEDNDIICGSGMCNALSQFCWYEPDKKPVDFVKREPRLKTAVVDKLPNYVCRRCGHNHFHLHKSGTITCYRCRHAASYKWWLPSEE